MKLDSGALVSLFEPFNRLGWLGILALIGVYSGIFLFFRGFRMLQHKRLILNTPLSKIRSASMGLVEVSGMATGPQTIPAGITGNPCYYYHASAWLQAESGKQQGWEKVADESVYVPFFVDDGTGRMLVYPQGAKLDVHRNFREEYGASFFASRELVPESVHKFLLRHCIATSGTIRLEEHCILPGYPLFVFGTLGENPRPGPWTPGALLDAAPSSFNPPSSSLQPQSQFGATAPASSPFMTTKHVFTANGRMRVSLSAATMQAHTTHTDPSGAPSPSGVTNRTGCSPDNRNAQRGNVPEFDLHPHAAITKGERDELFMISSSSQREVAQFLGWKAIACILGGPVIAMSCLFFLIIYLAWS